MKKQITFLSILYISLTTLQGQVEKQSLPNIEEISNRRSSFNLDEIKVRWKKAALENCTGVPCTSGPGTGSFTCGTSTVADIDGNTYNTVLIGTQCWTEKNLKVSKYNDGSLIPLNNTYTSIPFSTVWQGLREGAYTIYNIEPSTGTNATNYGFLYNWYASKGIITAGGTSTKNICPSGWHVPTDTEWTTLTTHLGGDFIAGGKMKQTGTTLWNTPNTGANNTSGFAGLPGGYRTDLGAFLDIRDGANFWSASEDNVNDAWFRALSKLSGIVNRAATNKSSGMSVRCLRD